MSRGNDNGISLATPPAIHVGPIVNPSTNETISIVIPLSAQLATLSGQKGMDKNCKDCKEMKPQTHGSSAPPTMTTPTMTTTATNTNRIRNDKTKGCPFPTCMRYGRAFSRAHDLKRHIARHEMRKEKLSEAGKHRDGENNGTMMNNERHMNLAADEREKYFSCPQCKKKYTSENNFRAHLHTHDKFNFQSAKNCALCGASFQTEMERQEHLKQHTASLLQHHADKSDQRTDKDDDFLLEEMLLLNKNPRRSEKNSNGSKIRCDYCSKTFKTKWTLSSHVAAHEGRFQFDCNQCGKRFVRKSHYEGHVRSHEAARPYICEQCGKTFKELKHRREHTKRKHPSNQNAIQTLLDSISSPCASEELPVDQAKFTLLMPVNFPS